MDLEELRQLVALGESERLEFKKTTGELRSAMTTLCRPCSTVPAVRFSLV